MRARPQINEPEPQQGLATAHQAASYLSLSRTTIWRLEQQGVIRGIRLGRSLRFRWDDLLELASGQKGGRQ